MKISTVSDFLKALNNYDAKTPVTDVLTDLMFKNELDFIEIVNAYRMSLEYLANNASMQVKEANACITQFLLKRNDPDTYKRAIHFFNNSDSGFKPHSFDKEYSYTEEDEEHWQKFFEEFYGIHK